MKNWRHPAVPTGKALARGNDAPDSGFGVDWRAASEGEANGPGGA
jgi:hypothetical protein